MKIEIEGLLPLPLRTALADGRLVEASLPAWTRRFQEAPERVTVELAGLAASPGLRAAEDPVASAAVAGEVLEALTGRPAARPVPPPARPNVRHHDDEEIEAATRFLVDG